MAALPYISALFIITKKLGGYRPIVNLKPLNEYVHFEHFKMQGLPAVKSFLRLDDWFTKIDLKGAYLAILIHAAHTKFLRFEWRDRTFEFKVLPFG